MRRRIALHFGDALIVVSGISIAIALFTGIWDGHTAAMCTSTTNQPLIPVGIEGISLVVYDNCGYAFVSPWLAYGGVIGIIGAAILGAERFTRAHPIR